MPIVEDYLKYTKQWKAEYGEKTIVLMQVGSFFEVYALKNENNELTGSNIEDFASINDMIIAEKAKMKIDKCKVVMAGFGIAQLDKYVKKLQDHGYTSVIYCQDIQGKNTSRSLTEIISPGTYFSQENTEISNNVMCIWLHKSEANKILNSQITVGISNIDIYTGKTSVFQFSKEYYHNPCTYDELEKYIAIHNPNECIIISNLEKNIINDIIEYISIQSKKIHIISINDDNNTNMIKFAKNSEKQIYQKEILNKFYPNIPENDIISLLPTHNIAIQSFTLLLDFVYQHSPYLVDKLSLPIFENNTERLILANHSLKQLNIIDDTRHTGKNRSVGALLNNCKTSMGKREFMYNLHNPTTNISKLNDSYNITQHIIEKNEWQKYRDLINGIRDLEKFERKIILKKISPKDISLFANDLLKILDLFLLIKNDTLIINYCTNLINNNINNIDEQINNILNILNKNFFLSKSSFIDDVTQEKLSSMSQDKLSFIKDGISEKIDTLTSKCLDSRNILFAIANKFNDIIAPLEKSKLTKNYIKIHETPKSDPVLIATKRRITLLKNALSDKNKYDNTISVSYTNHKQEIITIELEINNLEFKSIGNNKTDLCITNDYINSLTNNINNTEETLINEIIFFYKNFINDFVSQQNTIKNISNFVKIIDILQCKAYIANKYNYCKPIITNSDKSFITFTGIRHPLIEHLQTEELYVTNDLELGKDIDGLLLYGTNAVGKTSLIKSIGISIIMAQAGLYVPCNTFNFFPYSCVFTRILGNDNIFKGLSTFAVEMSELRTILNLADNNSLILGDELCSGTESDSALSIFTAGLESLHERRSTFLFATHFHEIINFDEIKNLTRLVMKHMEVKYDQQKDMLIYDRKLKDGPGNSMYGLEVCKSLNLSSDFLQRAHDIRMKYNTKSQNILNETGSHFNRKKIKGLCELCNINKGTEVHHLQHQSNANNNNYINSFHKNHLANLVNICEECHNKIHETDKQHKKVKTTKGYILSTL